MERGGAGSIVDDFVSRANVGIPDGSGLTPVYLRAVAVMGAIFALSLYCALFLTPSERTLGEDTTVQVGAVSQARRAAPARRRADSEGGASSDQERLLKRRAQARALGTMLRMARLVKGASQEQLALDAGIMVYTYGGLERGHTPRGDEVNPTFDTVMRILHALDIEVKFKPRCADGLWPRRHR